MQIDINEVIRHIEWRKGINSIPLEKIEWIKDGQKIQISQEVIDNWKFTGLNNIDFINTGAYLEKNLDDYP